MSKSFVDIHSHVLWGMDDGAQSLRETVALCDCAEQCGTSTLFLTPHLMYWSNAEQLCDERDEKTEQLEDALADKSIVLDLKKGFEILCDDDIFDVKYFKPYTLNESRYILIEFDFFKTTEDDVKSWCRYLSSFGLVPVIAHPERYGFVSNNVSCLDDLSQAGVLFQINAGSPVGLFGDRAMDVSCKMLEAGYVDFIGSDAHRINARNTDMETLFDDYPYKITEDDIIKFSCLNPKFIIEDKKYTPIRKKYIKEI